jgi:hypothetical protein
VDLQNWYCNLKSTQKIFSKLSVRGAEQYKEVIVTRRAIMVEFDITMQDVSILGEIYERAKQLNLVQGDKVDFLMDMSVAHSTRPLDLRGLLKTDDFNFAHDVVGIQNHIDRD